MKTETEETKAVEVKIVSRTGKTLFVGKGSIADVLKAAVNAGADLRSANLHGADLRSADLRSADLGGANLHGADLRSANLHGADLRSADLRSADLRSANLHGADLRSADLRSADLGGANLRSANLRGADLHGADLAFQLCPAEGDFIAYEAVQGAILKLRIVGERTSSLIGRKCRCSAAEVLAYKTDGAGPWNTDAALFTSKHGMNFKYVVGERVEAKYNDDIRLECTEGIHFFVTEKEAKDYL